MDRATQIKIINILKKELSSTLGLDDDTYRSMLNSMFGVNSSTLLNDMQCVALIAKLNTPSQNIHQASQKQLLYIEDLFQNFPIQTTKRYFMSLYISRNLHQEQRQNALQTGHQSYLAPARFFATKTHRRTTRKRDHSNSFYLFSGQKSGDPFSNPRSIDSKETYLDKTNN